MARKGILDTSKRTVVKAAKVGAEGVKDVASDALGAAASAAAGVVLERVSKALSSGQKKADEVAPRARRSVSASIRRKPTTKQKRTTRGHAATKARLAKRRSAAKKRSARRLTG